MLLLLCYIDVGFFDFEKCVLFDYEWLCVGWVDWLFNLGDFYIIIVVNEFIVVVYDCDGIICVMFLVCQYCVMLVVEGVGNICIFICLYYYWVYNLKGDLINVLVMEKICNFYKEILGLFNFKLEIWYGFIFINFDDDVKLLVLRLIVFELILVNYEIVSVEGLVLDCDI